MLKWPGRGAQEPPRPLNFCGCDLTEQWLLAREHAPVQLPAAAPTLQAERQHAAESPKLSLLRAARSQPAIFFLFWDRGRQAMHLPCKQAYVGALPTDSTSLRPLRCGGRRLPRRSSESEGGLYRTAMRGFGSAGQFQMRETRPMNREKPHKLLQVGVTPTPPYTREVIRLPDCKSGVRK